MNKTVAVIVAAFNRKELLIKCIDALLDQSRAVDRIYIIDNASTDRTVELLKDIANENRNIKIIVNSRNFGHIRSPVHGMAQASGEVVILLVADLQDPPEMIYDFVRAHEEGYEVVLAIKTSSKENSLMYRVRSLYYQILAKVSEIDTFENYTGFGLYDKKIMNALRNMPDAYPFFRGMVAEIGYKVKKIPYSQPRRGGGVTKNNFYTLYDVGILGLINNSKILLRLSIFIGFVIGILSIVVGLYYFLMKLLYWDSISIGVAPILIWGSLIFSILLFFIGILGEYIGQIYTQVLNRPLVFERERINFD